MIEANVKGIDSVESALREKLKDFIKNPKSLKVGIFETAKYDTGLYVAQNAFWHEYGTLKIPMRPFFRNAYTKNKAKWMRFFAKQCKDSLNFEVALGRTGEIMRGDIIKSLMRIEPPNKPSTIRAKKSSKPLIDTGLLRASISYQIKENNAKSTK